MKRLATLVVGVALVLSIPSTALAASSTCQAYSSQTCTNIPTSTGVVSTAKTGTLPFTGVDVVLLLVGAGLLIGTGFVVRQLSNSAR